MGKRKPQHIPCARTGCKKFAMRDGSGFCQSHDPEKAESRRQDGLKAVAARKMKLTPDKKCAVEGCKTWHTKNTVYCPLHFKGHDPNSGQIFCQKESCRGQLLDTSGYCFAHSPLLAESRSRRLIKQDRLRKEGPKEVRCHHDGCKRFPLRDGSGFCYNHNPDLAQKRSETAKSNIARSPWVKVPPDRACKIKGCKKWAQEDGSHLCFKHQPISRLNMQNRWRVHHPTRGRHMPWLGLKDIKEARGLLWYSLEMDRPLLTLRALTKIVSLHARGEIYSPAKHGADDLAALSSYEKDLLLLSSMYKTSFRKKRVL